MEMELNKLIEKIKTEGVQRAEEDANNIIKDAEKKADEIIKEAQKRKEDIIKDGDNQARNFRKNAEMALKQSARDVLLALRKKVEDLSNRVVKEKVAHELTEDLLKELIIKAVENFRKDTSSEIDILVSQKDKDRLQKLIFGALGQKVKEGLRIKGSMAIEKGFRIGERDKDSYIDFTDEAIAEAFKRYLNPKLAEVLNID